MKILFLANAASIHTARWVNAMSERGHEVHLVFKYDDSPKEKTLSEKIHLHRLKYAGSKGYFLNAKELMKLSNSIRPNIVNAHYASGYGTLARLARLKPLVLSVWGADVYDFPYQSRLKMRVLVNNLKYANMIASTSHSMADHVLNILKDYNKPIAVTPFGIDIDVFNPHNVNTNVAQRGKLIIGNIKTLTPKYGIDDFIKAVRILLDDLISIKETELSEKIAVKIYGEGDQRDSLSELISELNLDNHVSLEGKIPHAQVPSRLNEFEIFCATSTVDSESFGVSVVEAMAMELPVVATDVSGFKEVVDNGITGLIVKRKSPQEIACALKKLILDKNLRESMGIHGRNKVIEHYNWNDNVSTMEQVYHQAISDGSLVN